MNRRDFLKELFLKASKLWKALKEAFLKLIEWISEL